MTELTDFAEKHNFSILHDCSDTFYKIWTTSWDLEHMVNNKNHIQYFPLQGYLAHDHSRYFFPPGEEYKRLNHVQILGIIHDPNIPTHRGASKYQHLIIGKKDYKHCYIEVSAKMSLSKIEEIKRAEEWLQQRRKYFAEIYRLMQSVLGKKDVINLDKDDYEQLKALRLHEAWKFITKHYDIPKLLDKVPNVV